MDREDQSDRVTDGMPGSLGWGVLIGVALGMLSAIAAGIRRTEHVQRSQAASIEALKEATETVEQAVTAMDEHTGRLQGIGIWVALAGAVIVLGAAVLGAYMTHWLTS